MKTIFSSDGIRNKVGEGILAPNQLTDLGSALAASLPRRQQSLRLLLARDNRESTPEIINPLIDGLLSGDADVFDVGVLSTPALSFLTRALHMDAGIVVSASHNPVCENGIKLFDSAGAKISDSIQDKIVRYLQEGCLANSGSGTGRINLLSGALKTYIAHVLRDMHGVSWSRVPVLFDCANGAASDAVNMSINILGMKAGVINAEPNGVNENRFCGTEHFRRYPEQMARLLASGKWKLGVVLDGDGDRVLLIDRKARCYDGDSILTMLAFILREQNRLPNNGVVVGADHNRATVNYLTSNGFDCALVDRPGDKYVTECMQRNGYVLGAEQCGNIAILEEDVVTGDGLRIALYLLRSLCSTRRPSLTYLSRDFQKSPQVRANARLGREMDLPNSNQIDDIVASARHTLPPNVHISVRFASTEPIVRITLEGDPTSSLEYLAFVAFRVAKQIQILVDCGDLPVTVLDWTCGGRLMTVKACPETEFVHCQSNAPKTSLRKLLNVSAGIP